MALPRPVLRSFPSRTRSLPVTNRPRNRHHRRSAPVVLILALVGAAVGMGSVPAQATPAPTHAGVPGMEAPLYAGGASTDTFPSNPVISSAAEAPAEASSTTTSGPAATFTVNYDAGFNANLPARTAFQAAVDIWANTITSPVPIVVDARLTTQSCGGTVFTPGVLGTAGPTFVESDFPGATLPTTFYPVALANAMSGSDLEPGTADICAAFNQGESNFYFGTDSLPPLGKFDFTSIVLHELGHGLGFIGSMRKNPSDSTQADCCPLHGFPTAVPTPYVYDQFTTNGGGSPLPGFPHPSTALMTELTSNNIFFRGTNTNAVTGVGGAKLFSPATFQSGSTYSHLDEATFPCAPAATVGCTGANSLMTPSINGGEVEHSPGPIMLGMFADMGWQFASTPPHFVVSATTPAVAGVPDNFTVTATDAFGATVTSYAGTVHFTTTAASATLPSDSTLTNGVGTFQATLRTAGNQTITATDTVTAAIVGTSNAIVVNPAAAQTLTLTAPSQMVSGTPAGISVTAFDTFGNVATTYAGTLHFTTTSASFALPANSTLTNGVGAFSATLSTFGLQTITATDTVTASLTATSGPITVADGSGFHALPPARILDTRPGAGNIGITTGPVGTTAKPLTVWGAGGVPSGAAAVVMNVTVTAGSNNSFLTVFPTGTTPPNASNLNFAANETIPNLVTVKLSGAGQASFINANGTTHVVGDVVGWYDDGTDITGNRYVATAPNRVLDTRPGAGNVGITTGKVGTTPKSLQIGGTPGFPAGVTAVVMNVTVTNGTNASFLTAFPGGTTPPNASNLNFAANETIPNLVVVALGSGGGAGQVDFVNAIGATDVVGDVVGYYTSTDPGGGFLALPPSRVLDTRPGPGNIGIVGPVGTTAKTMTIAGNGGVPASGATAVVMNVTVTNGSKDSFLTVFPGGTTPPNASNLNFGAFVTIPNLVVVKLSPTGTVSFINANGTTDVVADVVGWYT